MAPGGGDPGSVLLGLDAGEAGPPPPGVVRTRASAWTPRQLPQGSGARLCGARDPCPEACLLLTGPPAPPPPPDLLLRHPPGRGERGPRVRTGSIARGTRAKSPVGAASGDHFCRRSKLSAHVAATPSRHPSHGGARQPLLLGGLPTPVFLPVPFLPQRFICCGKLSPPHVSADAPDGPFSPSGHAAAVEGAVGGPLPVPRPLPLRPPGLGSRWWQPGRPPSRPSSFLQAVYVLPRAAVGGERGDRGRAGQWFATGGGVGLEQDGPCAQHSLPSQGRPRGGAQPPSHGYPCRWWLCCPAAGRGPPRPGPAALTELFFLKRPAWGLGGRGDFPG